MADLSDEKILLYIGGMTCVNCQNKIEKKLNNTDGIESVSVSYTKGTAEIIYDKETISLDEITEIIEKLDYEVLSGKENHQPDIVRIVCMLVIIISLYILLQTTGVLNLLVPSRLADTKMGYGMLFVIGLITSVHCIAMCGGINLSQCIPQSGKPAANEGKLAHLRPSFLYNLGRVISYTVIGFILGTVGFLIGGGSQVGIGVLVQGILKIIAGLFMIIMGINMLGIFPALRKFTIRMPKAIARKVGKEKVRSNRPFYVGILNGIMPCGPLQSMWIVALASGNPVAGAISMFLFSMGTVPLMLGLGTVVAVLGKKFTDKVMTIGSILVVVLGLAMLSQGGTLSGWLSSDMLFIIIITLAVIGVILSIPVRRKSVKGALKLAAITIVVVSMSFWNGRELLFGSSQNTEDTDAEIVDGVQIVRSTLETGKYPNITVQVGIPVKWIIDAPEGSINGCNYKMLIQDLDLEHTFQTGENIIEFTPEEIGTIRYNCWMGMIYGNIFVVDKTDEAKVSGDNAVDGDNSSADEEAVKVPEYDSGYEDSYDVIVPTSSGYLIPTDELAVASVVTDEQGNTYQEVSIRLTDEGFEPAVAVVQKDMYVVWNIDVSLENANEGIDILASYYSTILTLESGENQLSLYPTADFDIAVEDYSAFAYLKVVEDLDNIDESAIRTEVAEYDALIYPSEIYAGSVMSCCD